MRDAAFLVAAALVAGLPGSAAADGESDRRSPSVAYVFPAGGARGTTVQVLAGGQNLRGASAAFVSGQGATATVQRWVRPLNPMQMQELRRRIAETLESRGPGRRAAAPAGAEAKPDPVELPDHPLLKDFDKRSPKELRDIAARFISPASRRQQNVQLAEQIEVDVAIDADAPPGEREIRFLTEGGLTNPLRFQVGTQPEIREDDPGDARAWHSATLEPPVVVNGQVLPGDSDRFAVRAKKGQRLVVDVAARRLVPFLADAVPGWFQAQASLSDSRGNEIAFDDDFRFDPDPVLCAEIPADGDYVLEIRDALWRGREDFVYRVTVGDEPFVTRIFPLGGRAGYPASVSIAGWNLGGASLALDTGPMGGPIRWTASRRGKWSSNAVPYGVDDLPECEEREDNGEERTAQPLALPVVVNGRIGRPGDADLYEFEGAAGAEVVAEVTARRLRSPLDSALTLTDAAGRAVAWNDDAPDAADGVLTHHADSYLRAKLPADGTYRLRLVDAQRQGGPEYAYRLRVSAPRPDFQVFASPSSLSVPLGRSVPFRVRVVRRDGFDGPVTLALGGAPAGFVLSGATVPAGKDTVRMTLTASAPFEGAVALNLLARTRAGEREIEHAVVPADDRMQAFAYRHLVPAEDLLAVVTGAKRGAVAADVVVDGPVRVPAGGFVEVRVRVHGRGVAPMLRLELEDPPPGVTMGDATTLADGLNFTLRAAATVAPGTADNLIVAVVAPGGRGGERRAVLGHLPAIPFEVVAPVPAR